MAYYTNGLSYAQVREAAYKANADAIAVNVATAAAQSLVDANDGYPTSYLDSETIEKTSHTLRASGLTAAIAADSTSLIFLTKNLAVAGTEYYIDGYLNVYSTGTSISASAATFNVTISGGNSGSTFVGTFNVADGAVPTFITGSDIATLTLMHPTWNRIRFSGIYTNMPGDLTEGAGGIGSAGVYWSYGQTAGEGLGGSPAGLAAGSSIRYILVE